MKNDTPPPDDGRLRSLLRESRPSPPLPPRFREAVWHRIERTEPAAATLPSSFAWLEQWVDRLLRPRFAVASLVLLLVAGGLTGVLTSAGLAKQQAQERYLAAVAPNPLR